MSNQASPKNSRKEKEKLKLSTNEARVLSPSDKLDSPDGSRLSREVNQDAPGESSTSTALPEKKSFTPRSDGFDMTIVAVNFERCVEDESLLMEAYLVAYEELERFFGLMGSIFGFVGADVKDKLEILNKHQQSNEEGRHYTSIRSMMVYETSSPALLEPARTTSTHPLPSASRTLLRLHRALEFIMMFMDTLITAPDDQGVAHLAQDCYGKTLAKYHGWLIRKGAHLAMYTLPTKYHLMEKISKHSYEEVQAFARRMVDSMKPVYDRTQDLYTEFRLHELP